MCWFRHRDGLEYEAVAFVGSGHVCESVDADRSFGDSKSSLRKFRRFANVSIIMFLSEQIIFVASNFSLPWFVGVVCRGRAPSKCQTNFGVRTYLHMLAIVHPGQQCLGEKRYIIYFSRAGPIKWICDNGKMPRRTPSTFTDVVDLYHQLISPALA